MVGPGRGGRLPMNGVCVCVFSVPCLFAALMRVERAVSRVWVRPVLSACLSVEEDDDEGVFSARDR